MYVCAHVCVLVWNNLITGIQGGDDIVTSRDVMWYLHVTSKFHWKGKRQRWRLCNLVATPCSSFFEGSHYESLQRRREVMAAGSQRGGGKKKRCQLCNLARLVGGETLAQTQIFGCPETDHSAKELWSTHMPSLQPHGASFWPGTQGITPPAFYATELSSEVLVFFLKDQFNPIQQESPRQLTSE